MNELLTSLGLDQLVSTDDIRMLIRVIVVLLVGIPVLFMIRRAARGFVTMRYSAHYGMLAGKVVWYTGFVLLVLVVMHQFNINLTPVLGAAGIVGVAVGFASQTSVSNVISGFFLIAEKSFVVGDVITVGNTTGTVLSVDTLSVKLRTADNRFVRIPNETMIKTEVINVSRFPLRRIDLTVGVAYKEDLVHVRSVLADMARQHPRVLDDPAPVYAFQAFGASSVDIQFSVWVLREHVISVKNELYEATKNRFEQENIEIPFPHMAIYRGDISDQGSGKEVAVKSEQRDDA